MTGAIRGDGSKSSGASQSTSISAPTVFTENTSSNTTLQITTHKVNGKNFLQWSRSLRMVIRGKGRIGYLNGTAKKPIEDNPTFPTWDAQNSMVMAWLIHFMEEKIGEAYLFYSIAKELWFDRFTRAVRQ